jgi:hypothetical protein
MKDWNQFIDPLQEKIQALASNKKMLIIIAGGAAVFIILLLLLAISFGMNHNQNEMETDSQDINQIFAPQAISPGELFLPDEPDFIPEVMLDREPRTSWTDEDAEQFWKDPLDGNTEAWKNRIHEAVDNLMENIP